MITVTENAVKHLHDLVESAGKSTNHGLRLSVERGGCAGWQYAMKVDLAHDGDHTIPCDGANLYVSPESLELLKDSQIDYVDSLTDAGFKINNPNAARSCGCGSSFEAAEEGKEPEYDPSNDGSACGSHEEDQVPPNA
ncbi:MAG: iron-sulfur cluster assembly accessory protein [Verrucomicrobiota bacterium]